MAATGGGATPPLKDDDERESGAGPADEELVTAAITRLPSSILSSLLAKSTLTQQKKPTVLPPAPEPSAPEPGPEPPPEPAAEVPPAPRPEAERTSAPAPKGPPAVEAPPWPWVEAVPPPPDEDEPPRPRPKYVSRDPSVEEYLFNEPFAFDFFQAVRLLEMIQPDRIPIGRGGPPKNESVRLRAHVSLSFPPSPIYDLEKGNPDRPFPVMTVAFFGLHGPSGILPRHYTEMLMRIEKETKSDDRHALRDWFDLFNHRMISHFFRAWEKYRFFVPYARGEYDRPEPDPFTLSLLSFVGLGMPPLRKRLRVSYWDEAHEDGPRERVLLRVEDLALLHYSGFLSHRPRNAVSLQAMLEDYFELPVKVQQFRGQWLRLEPTSQSAFSADGNMTLGLNVVAGERVWDVGSKIRLRIGPLGYGAFHEFLPDRSPIAARKAFFLICHLVRLYVGPELDYDVQLVLKAAEVPPLHMASEGGGIGPRLGWNTWVCSEPPKQDVDDAAFEGEEVFWLNPDERRRAFENII